MIFMFRVKMFIYIIMSKYTIKIRIVFIGIFYKKVFMFYVLCFLFYILKRIMKGRLLMIIIIIIMYLRFKLFIKKILCFMLNVKGFMLKVLCFSFIEIKI